MTEKKPATERQINTIQRMEHVAGLEKTPIDELKKLFRSDASARITELGDALAGTATGKGPVPEEELKSLDPSLKNEEWRNWNGRVDRDWDHF